MRPCTPLAWKPTARSREMVDLDRPKKAFDGGEGSRFYEYTFSPLTKVYWQKKHNLTPSSLITSINWEACKEAMGRLPFGKERWLLKHVTGFCGVGRREFLWGNQDHSECPRCGDPNKSTRHVVECKGKGSDITFTLAVQKLEANLTTFDTVPPIITAIMTKIRQWRKYGDNHLPCLCHRYISMDPITLWKARTRLAGTIFFSVGCQKSGPTRNRDTLTQRSGKTQVVDGRRRSFRKLWTLHGTRGNSATTSTRTLCTLAGWPAWRRSKHSFVRHFSADATPCSQSTDTYSRNQRPPF
jgi:hypothetical protein